MNKKWLLISHAFNMDGRASSITVTDKVPYLQKAGIHLIVLSAVTGVKDDRVEHHQLLAWGPAALRFDFRHWVANHYGRGIFYKLITPLSFLTLFPFIALEKLLIGLSSQASWFIPAALRGFILVKQGKVDLIYTSAGVWSALLAGWVIKKLTGVKWIVEIHDPLVTRWSPKDDGFSKRKTREARFMQKLEEMVCNDADHLWWFTEGALRYAKLRQKSLADKGFVVFPGSEPPGCYELDEGNHTYSGYLNIAHFGTLATDRSLVPLLEALAALFKEIPDAKNKVRIQVYGTDVDSASLDAMSRLNLDSNLISNGRFPRAQVVKLMRRADVLLVLHGTAEWAVECIPSKIYDYFWSKRPILGITDRNEQLRQMLEDRDSYLCQTNDQESINRTVKQVWEDWFEKKLRFQKYQPISPADAVNQILEKLN
jgi:glycosyltransferase involved in cell wall biosynthesis